MIPKQTYNISISEQSFDAWGRKRNATNWSYSSIATTPDWLYRGYTGHEHYEEFALINMNGRMYDPIIGRMLSVDNFVQDNTSTQGYNRYSYALNNPLKYTDPSGELFIIDTWLIGAVDGFFSKGGNLNARFTNSFRQANHMATKDARIYAGLGQGNFGQIVSRFTYELPQTLVGLSFSLGQNTFGDVEEVGYYDGVTIVNANGNVPFTRAISLGSYIIGEDIAIDPNEVDKSGIITEGARLLRHEYGHVLQSRKNGYTFLFKYGIASAGGANWTERDAELRANNYFNDFYKFPDAANKKRNAKWWEFTFPILSPFFNPLNP